MMTCIACRLEKRSELEAELIKGTPLRSRGERFGVSDHALMNHRDRCIPKVIAKGRDAADTYRADNLISHLEHIKAETLRLYERNVGVDDGIALKSLHALESQVQTAAR